MIDLQDDCPHPAGRARACPDWALLNICVWELRGWWELTVSPAGWWQNNKQFEIVLNGKWPKYATHLIFPVEVHRLIIISRACLGPANTCEGLCWLLMLGGVVWCGVVWCGVVWCGVVLGTVNTNYRHHHHHSSYRYTGRCDLWDILECLLFSGVQTNQHTTVHHSTQFSKDMK